MDASFLSHQVNSIIEQLHGLFDDIGVPSHDREARETELFAALSDTLNNHVRQVNSEKKDLIEQAQQLISAIRQMEASLEDGKESIREKEDDGLRVTYPLVRCLKVLHEKHQQIHRIHRERFAQVKKLADALESYSSHLEPTFVSIPLPPTNPKAPVPLNFDLSPSYVDKLDVEFTRVYDEYTQRIQAVQNLSEKIISLWAELGTPQVQTDSVVVKHYRDSPEQLGLHKEDLNRLEVKYEKLLNEKKAREKHLNDLKASVESMWSMLGVDEAEKKAFLNANRGCGVRQINEFEDEMSRLSELKRQNLHLFVEDARCKLQELWDALYFSEDEMLEFTPAFSDVYSDALLDAHEREIARLECLREQRAPMLSLIDKHRDLTAQKEELAQSSQDASRLMLRGQKGERRDPGKLLREEKMRKRIAKELPKVVAELRKALEKYEGEFSVPFLVQGERYLDTLEEEAGSTGRKGAASQPRPKTPGAPVMPSNSASSTAKVRPLSKAISMGNLKTNTTAVTAAQSAGRGTAKMTATGAKQQPQQPPRPASTAPGSIGRFGPGSPTRIPARAPLANLKYGKSSPERAPAPRPSSRAEVGTLRHGDAPIMRAPPPKMRDPPRLETPMNPYKAAGLHDNMTGSIVRSVETDDVFGPPSASIMGVSQFSASRYAYASSSSATSSRPDSLLGGPRQVSGSSTQISGSENWETYDDTSEPEPDASDAYYAKLRIAQGKRYAEELAMNRSIEDMKAHSQSHAPSYSHASHHSNGSQGGYSSSASGSKRIRGFPQPVNTHGVLVDADGNRVPSGREWTDEDAGYSF
ncbi:Microtubule bundling protein [Ceratocystis pirilliformis]|uniref:Microtubule bundling protein n=1 Tax=Ceratocystis pirilliformis TaxID=259994 RepID=A0ABR3YU39_9PEZI